VSLVDLYPTLIELCGLTPVEGLDGVSLTPWLRDPDAPRQRPAIIVEESGHMAVRSDHFRYIRYKNGSEELYDHRNDPRESTNLADVDTMAEQKQRLAAFLPQKLAPPAPTKKAYEFDPRSYSWTVKKTGQTIVGKDRR